MGKFNDLLNKEGEAVNHYVHSWEDDRNTTTNLKVSKWATLVEIRACVRSQSKVLDKRDLGEYYQDSIVLLTMTPLAALDVVGWNSKFYDVLLVEPQYWKGVLQYYKATCQERLEFIGN